MQSSLLWANMLQMYPLPTTILGPGIPAAGTCLRKQTEDKSVMTGTLCLETAVMLSVN